MFIPDPEKTVYEMEHHYSKNYWKLMFLKYAAIAVGLYLILQ